MFSCDPCGLGGGGLLVITYDLYPAVPTGLSATAMGTSQIDLAWDAADDATGYDIQSSPDDATWSNLDSTSDPEYSDTTLAPGETRYYRVRGTNSFGKATGRRAILRQPTRSRALPTSPWPFRRSMPLMRRQRRVPPPSRLQFQQSTPAGALPPAGTGSVAFGSDFAGSGSAIQPITGTGAVTLVVSAISGSGVAPLAAGPGSVAFAVSGLAASGGITTSGPATMAFAVSTISAFGVTDPHYDTARRRKHFEEFSNVETNLDLT
jgi:hypothetical protein